MKNNGEKFTWTTPKRVHEAALDDFRGTLVKGVRGASVAGALIITFIFFFCNQVIPGKITTAAWYKASYIYAGVIGFFVILIFILPLLSQKSEYSADDEGIRQYQILYKWEYFKGYSVADHPVVKEFKMISFYKKDLTKAGLKGIMRPKMADVMSFSMPDRETLDGLTALAAGALPEMEPVDRKPYEIPCSFKIPVYVLWMITSIAAGYYIALNRHAMYSIFFLLFLFGPGFIIGALSLWHYRDKLNAYPNEDRLKIILYVLVLIYGANRPLFEKWKILKAFVAVLNTGAVFTAMIFVVIFAIAKI